MRNSAQLHCLLLLTSIFAAGYSVAEPPAGDQPSSQATAATQDKAPSLQRQSQQLQQQIQQREQQLSTLAQRSDDDIDNMNQAQKALEHATARYVTDASETSQAKIKNARFKIVLAKRQVKANREQQIQLTQQLSTLNTQLLRLDEQRAIPLNNSVSTLSVTTSEKTSRADPNAESAHGPSPLQQAEEKLSADEIAAEITRLNNLLQQQGSTEPSRTAPSTAQPEEDQLNTIDMVAADLIADDITEASTTMLSSTASPVLQTRTDRLRLLSSRVEIVRSEKDLQNLLATKKGKPSTFDKMIIVKYSNTALDTVESNSYTLRSLGQDRYRAQIHLRPGQNQLVIGFNRWRLAASDLRADTVDSSTDYIVTMNNSDPQLPELLLYRKSLQ